MVIGDLKKNPTNRGLNRLGLKLFQTIQIHGKI